MLWWWFLCTGRHETANWSSYFKHLNSLVRELWHQKFHSQSDCLIFLHKVSPEWLDLLTSFAARQFSVMIETNWISFGHWWVWGFFAGVPWNRACFYWYICYFLIEKKSHVHIREINFVQMFQVKGKITQKR